MFFLNTSSAMYFTMYLYRGAKPPSITRAWNTLPCTFLQLICLTWSIFSNCFFDLAHLLQLSFWLVLSSSADFVNLSYLLRADFIYLETTCVQILHLIMAGGGPRTARRSRRSGRGPPQSPAKFSLSIFFDFCRRRVARRQKSKKMQSFR